MTIKFRVYAYFVQKTDYECLITAQLTSIPLSHKAPRPPVVPMYRRFCLKFYAIILVDNEVVADVYETLLYG